jgi:glycosyltransferase involved in cell wall biosynthesis
MSAPVSVVIPTYNSAAMVTQAIDSVLKQTVAPAEVVVVDDGSRDDTRARVAAYGGPVCYVHQENQGVASARNMGIRHSRQEFVAFLDADDVWHPRKIDLHLAALERRPEIGMMGTRVFGWPADTIPEVVETADGEIEVVPWERLALKNHFVTSTIIVRRSVLERAGEFDRELHGPEDYDLWLRLAELAPVSNLHVPLAGYRRFGNGLSKHATNMETGLRRILRKMDERDAWGGRWLLRRRAHSFSDYVCAYMYRDAGSEGVALRRLVRSLVRYPLPYPRSEVRVRFGRPRMLLSGLLAPLGVGRRAATTPNEQVNTTTP